MKYTVFGGSGFVGTNLIRHLEGLGHDVAVPARAVSASDLAEAGDLGHVIYAIGVTGNFRGNPGPTIDAHVNSTPSNRFPSRTGIRMYLYRLLVTTAARRIRENTGIHVVTRI